MALAPNFPTSPYVYVLYTYDHSSVAESAAPLGDACPIPRAPTPTGAWSAAALAAPGGGKRDDGPEQVLVEDWCQQYPSHSIGTLEFEPDGALYASAGDGASFNFVDYGQDGTLQPVRRSPRRVGATLTPPTAEVARCEPRTSAPPVTPVRSTARSSASIQRPGGPATNPLAGNADPNARRIIAYGLRNPFRFTFRPGTSELWIGDVGWGEWEEINRILDPTDAIVENFGWPCYEGTPPVGLRLGQPHHLREPVRLTRAPSPSRTSRTTTRTRWSRARRARRQGLSISGLSFEFAPQAQLPSRGTRGALLRRLLAGLHLGDAEERQPIPSPGSIDTFVAAAANPVNLEFGPDGDLYYADFDGGTIRRIAPDRPPSASQPLPQRPHVDLDDERVRAGRRRTSERPERADGDGTTLTLNGTTYAKGLGACPLRGALLPRRRLHPLQGAAWESTTRQGRTGSVVFQVFADATRSTTAA